MSGTAPAVPGPTPTTITRPCEAPAPPGSPRPRYRHPSMSGADPRRGCSTPTTIARPCRAPTLAGFAPPPPPSSPRRRGSRLVSTGMDGRPGVRTAVSAIAAGPGCAAFFVGERTWIPAFRGDDGREGVRRSAEGEAGQGRPMPSSGDERCRARAVSPAGSVGSGRRPVPGGGGSGRRRFRAGPVPGGPGSPDVRGTRP